MLALLLLAEKALGGASNYAVYIKVDCTTYNVISECAQNVSGACSELHRNIFRFYGNLFCMLQENFQNIIGTCSEHHRNVFRMLQDTTSSAQHLLLCLSVVVDVRDAVW